MKFNVLIGIILFVICVSIGVIISKNYEKKRKFFEELDNFNKKLEVEVSYKKSSIIDIINEYNGQIKILLKTKFIDNQKIDKNKIDFLKENEIEFLNEYFNSIGISESESQIKVINANSKIIQEYRTKAKINEEKLKPLCVKLGFFAGLILFILFL